MTKSFCLVIDFSELLWYSRTKLLVKNNSGIHNIKSLMIIREYFLLVQ